MCVRSAAAPGHGLAVLPALLLLLGKRGRGCRSLLLLVHDSRADEAQAASLQLQTRVRLPQYFAQPRRLSERCCAQASGAAMPPPRPPTSPSSPPRSTAPPSSRRAWSSRRSSAPRVRRARPRPRPPRRCRYCPPTRRRAGLTGAHRGGSSTCTARPPPPTTGRPPAYPTRGGIATRAPP